MSEEDTAGLWRALETACRRVGLPLNKQNWSILCTSTPESEIAASVVIWLANEVCRLRHEIELIAERMAEKG